MAKRAGRVVTKDAWHDPRELSFTEIHVRVQTYWLRILNAYKEMTTLRRLFRRQEILWPDQCDKILKVIEKICRPMHEFRTFLDQSALLPPTICTARYPLAEALICLDMQFSELYALVNTCMTASKSSSQEAFQLLPDIHQKLKELQVSWSSVRRGTQTLLACTQISPALEIAGQTVARIINLDSRRMSQREKRMHLP